MLSEVAYALFTSMDASQTSAVRKVFAMLDGNKDGLVSTTDVFMHLVIPQHPLASCGISDSQIRTQYLLRCMSYSGSAANEKAFLLYHHVLSFYASSGLVFSACLNSMWR